jgi:hypothetical protein
MAGRVYRISNLPARTPSNEIIDEDVELKKPRKRQPVVSHRMSLDDIDDDDLEFEDDAEPFDDSDDFSIGKRASTMLAIIAGVVGICLVLYYFIFVPLFDITNGAADGDAVVKAVANSMDNFSYADIENYVPKALRDYGFISDSDAFARFRELDFEKEYKLTKIVLQDEQPYTDLSALEDGIFTVYKRHIPVSDAVAASLRLDFLDNKNQPVSVECNLISIKVNYRWYLYTGSEVEFNGEPFEFMVLEGNLVPVEASTELSETEISYKRAVTAAEVDEIVEEDDIEDVSDQALDFYADAAKDLAKGQCTVNGVIHTMPDAFVSFGDIFSLNENKLGTLRTTVLEQDETISNLPISFTDSQYADTPFALTIGNTSTSAIDFRDARVTTLYIGESEDGNAPEVLLPGNVTFGTSKSDVFKMYGTLSEVNDSTFKGTLADSVYALELSNKRNKIYFGFKDSKLVEIQWYYIDMTNYRDL